MVIIVHLDNLISDKIFYPESLNAIPFPSFAFGCVDCMKKAIDITYPRLVSDSPETLPKYANVYFNLIFIEISMQKCYDNRGECCRDGIKLSK